MDRTVVYFKDGEIADFSVDEDSYDAFRDALKDGAASGDDALLEQSRLLLESVVTGQSSAGGDLERGAVCFIWYYFNESGRHQPLGDVVIVDQGGTQRQIQYIPSSQVEFSRIQ